MVKHNFPDQKKKHVWHYSLRSSNTARFELLTFLRQFFVLSNYHPEEPPKKPK